MMRWDLGRPSRIGREQCKEIMSHWLPKPLSNTLAGVTVSRSSSVLAEAEINGNDAAKIWKQADQPINIAWWLQKNTTNRFWGSWANGSNIAELSPSKDAWASGCFLQTYRQVIVTCNIHGKRTLKPQKKEIKHFLPSLQTWQRLQTIFPRDYN